MIHLDGHKFEARYDETLLAPWPEGRQVFHDRSPIHVVRPRRGADADHAGPGRPGRAAVPARRDGGGAPRARASRTPRSRSRARATATARPSRGAGSTRPSSRSWARCSGSRPPTRSSRSSWSTSRAAELPRRSRPRARRLAPDARIRRPQGRRRRQMRAAHARFGARPQRCRPRAGPQRGHAAIDVGERRGERRQPEADHVRLAEVDDHAARDEGVDERRGVGVADRDVAAAPGGIARAAEAAAERREVARRAGRRRAR